MRHLRAYLEMAATDRTVLPRRRARAPGAGPAPRGDRRRAAERGLDVRTDVGLSEFAIDLVLGAAPTTRGGRLLDGPDGRDAVTARDRDALPREVLVG